MRSRPTQGKFWVSHPRKDQTRSRENAGAKREIRRENHCPTAIGVSVRQDGYRFGASGGYWPHQVLARSSSGETVDKHPELGPKALNRKVDMDYSSAAHHYMMAPPPPPSSHPLLSSQGSNVHGRGQWPSSGDQQLLPSSSLMHQHQLQQQHCSDFHPSTSLMHQHQLQQQQQHCSDFQERFSPHPHMVPNAHLAHLHESQEEGRDAKRPAARNQGNGEEMSTSDSFKRPRLEQATAPFKTQVRKEKLGERITALQQLVSPFGKTDTASVLQEAIGYIKFLQDQVQVLSTPYMKPTVKSGSINHHDSQELGKISNWSSSNVKSTDHDVRQDLRSRGLCLVPVSCTLQVANDNGADFWTPAVGGGCR